MKTRARMRHRSLTNSRPHLNEALRRHYLEEHPYCELMQILDESRDEKWFQLMKNPPILTVEVHHIFSEQMRPDYWWNFTTVCRPAHLYCHDKPTQGRIACIRNAVINGNVNEGEFYRVFGFHLSGWLDGVAQQKLEEQMDRDREQNRDSSVPYFERLRMECLECIG